MHIVGKTNIMVDDICRSDKDTFDKVDTGLLQDLSETDYNHCLHDHMTMSSVSNDFSTSVYSHRIKQMPPYDIFPTEVVTILA